MMITGFRHGTKPDEAVQRFEIFTGSGRRRDWSAEEKTRALGLHLRSRAQGRYRQTRLRKSSTRRVSSAAASASNDGSELSAK